MQLSFRQNLPTKEISVPKKDLEINLNPKFFWGIGFIFIVIFFGIIFNLDKKESKDQKNKEKLEYLKARIRDGQSLAENEKKDFCKLLWVVEGVAIDNCENLSIEQYNEFVEQYQRCTFPNEKILRKIFEVEEDKKFEDLKRDEILPYYYSVRVQKNIKNYLDEKIDNPDVGYWSKEQYFVFRTSSFNTKSKKNFCLFVLYYKPKRYRKMITVLDYYVAFYGKKKFSPYEGEDFSPKKFQEETNFVFSQLSEVGEKYGLRNQYTSRGGSAKILADENESFLDFLKRLKEYNKFFTSQNVEKYHITEIRLYIECYFTSDRGFYFDRKELKAIHDVAFIQKISIKETNRKMRYKLYAGWQELYENSIQFLKNRLKKAREMRELSYEQVAQYGFISAKQLENLENSEKIQKIDFFLVKELAKIYKQQLTFFYKEDNFY